jgi:catechol 2,3-dioxygenase-like lactoylglutathione lyase family enzyme
MKVNSISGVTCYVEDLQRSAEFYEAIGFRRGKEEEDRVTFYVNWFSATFIARGREDDAGLFLNIKVDDIEEFHKAALSKGMEPQDEPSGNREFALRDPDGHKLAFFEKK